MKIATRKPWRNHTGNQSIDPLRIYWPESVEDLVRVIEDGEELKQPVRAVGTGHSWSDVALTPGFLVETSALPQFVETDGPWRDGVDERLARVGAGMPIRVLNAKLDEVGLALSNMGGYDAQTMAGVISTSTHGSGTGFGPLSDFIRSLDLVASRGKRYRIEPADGPTDPGGFSEAELIQDDHWFRAAVVGMGCLGLIHALTLVVEDEYALTEVRSKSSWEEVKGELRGGVLDRHRHYEVYLNPHPREGRNLCMVTTRDRARRDWRWWPPSRRRNSLPEFIALLPITPHFLNLVTDWRPGWSPWLLDRALLALADEEFTSASYRVLNIGAANLLPAYSAEIAVPVDARESHIEAVDRIIEIADEHRRIGGIYHTSPIALRFVKASSAYMSMMEGRLTMMIELIQMTRTEGGMELLAAYEHGLAELGIGARPHWGQINGLTADRLVELYPHSERWLDVHQQLNRSGVFGGPFSKRLEISTGRLLARP
jgi:L-gulono-1,4-lactone dehydrogenase